MSPNGVMPEVCRNVGDRICGTWGNVAVRRNRYFKKVMTPNHHHADTVTEIESLEELLKLSPTPRQQVPGTNRIWQERRDREKRNRGKHMLQAFSVALTVFRSVSASGTGGIHR